VASTKAFVMLTVLSLLAVHLGRMRMLSVHRALEILRAWKPFPDKSSPLATGGWHQETGSEICAGPGFLFLSRGFTYPIALEGALKLKEISYIHAEGYSARK